MNNKWTTVVEEDPATGELILPFPQEMIEKCGWLEGDDLDFTIEGENVTITNLSLNERILLSDK